MRLHTLNALIGFIFLAVAMDGRTSDGVLEINQACALNGGCFSGDAAGFPVTIDGSAGVSYRLTGSLDLTAHPTLAAISISKAYVTLDLNGFEIAGVASCELAPGGFDWDCAPRNSGAHGIALASGAESVTIKDGTIRNMPDDGISGSGARLIRVQGITASENAGWGVLLGNQGMISESSARLNDQGGFSVQDDANISHSVAYFNGGVGFDAESRAVVVYSNGVGSTYRGFNLGPNSRYLNNTARWQLNGEPALCGGGICTEARRFYLTPTQHDGANALAACTDGFHMASMYEVHEMSQLRYDTVLGFTRGDSGGGPPGDAEGWIRTGGSSSSNLNCDGWQTNSGLGDGHTTKLEGANGWAIENGGDLSPWFTDQWQCNAS